MTLRAVTFDYWRTLVWEPPGELERVRIEHFAPLLIRAGLAVSDEQLRAAHAAAFARASASWRANVQYRVEHAAHDILDHLGADVDAHVREDLAQAFSDAGRETPLQLAPGVKDALVGIRSRGLRVGIVCDVGLTPSPVLREHLERRGLLELFDHWSFSDETGDYKPATAPFMHACRGLHVSAEHVAHVGDQRRTDIVGAMNAGIVAVRYAGVFDDPDSSFPSGDVVIEHHDALMGALGIA